MVGCTGVTDLLGGEPADYIVAASTRNLLPAVHLPRT